LTKRLSQAVQYQQKVEVQGHCRFGVTRNLFGFGKVVGVWGGGVSERAELKVLGRLANPDVPLSDKKDICAQISARDITFDHVEKTDLARRFAQVATTVPELKGTIDLLLPLITTEQKAPPAPPAGLPGAPLPPPPKPPVISRAAEPAEPATLVKKKGPDADDAATLVKGPAPAAPAGDPDDVATLVKAGTPDIVDPAKLVRRKQLPTPTNLPGAKPAGPADDSTFIIVDTAEEATPALQNGSEQPTTLYKRSTPPAALQPRFAARLAAAFNYIINYFRSSTVTSTKALATTMLALEHTLDLGERLAACTRVGGRDHNEDAAVLAQLVGGQDRRSLLGAIDGMGGHESGEVASNLTAVTVQQNFEKAAASKRFSIKTAFEQAGKLIQAYVAKHLQHLPPKERIMGAAAVVADIDGDRAEISWAADARAFLFRNGQLTLLTTDNHLATKAYLAKRLGKSEDAVTYEDIRTLNFAASEQETIDYYRFTLSFEDNKVLAPVGQPDLQVMTRSVNLKRGDILLLSSDGLHGFLGFYLFKSAVADLRRAPAAVMANKLADVAVAAMQNTAKLGDNVTVAVYKHTKPSFLAGLAKAWRGEPLVPAPTEPTMPETAAARRSTLPPPPDQTASSAAPKPRASTPPTQTPAGATPVDPTLDLISRAFAVESLSLTIATFDKIAGEMPDYVPASGNIVTTIALINGQLRRAKKLCGGDEAQFETFKGRAQAAILALTERSSDEEGPEGAGS
jgi:PPM family protein phosphatase